MTVEEKTPPVETPPVKNDPPPPVDEGEIVDLESLIGNILDERGLTKDNLAKLGKLDGLDKLLNPPKDSGGGDNSSILDAISSLLDTKLEGVGNGKRKSEPGWLSKFLGGSS